MHSVAGDAGHAGRRPPTDVPSLRRRRGGWPAALMNSLLCDVRRTATETVWQSCRDDTVKMSPLPFVNIRASDKRSNQRLHSRRTRGNFIDGEALLLARTPNNIGHISAHDTHKGDIYCDAIIIS